MQTRPTPDRVREALFSILGARVVDASILDLYAGSGAIGIEGLSRGASRAVFVENNPKTAELLESNLGVLGDVAATVMVMPVENALSALHKRAESFDVVFLDPPYDRGLLQPSLDKLDEHCLIESDGLVITEHSAKSTPPTAPGAWEKTQTRTFGDVALSFYQSKGQNA